MRKVAVEIEALAFEAQARLIAGAALGRALRARGFLCAKSARSKKPVLHVTQIEFAEGD
jgi:primosomal replication protein N